MPARRPARTAPRGRNRAAPAKPVIRASWPFHLQLRLLARDEVAVKASGERVELRGDPQGVQRRLAPRRSRQIAQRRAFLAPLDPEGGRLLRRFPAHAREMHVRQRQLGLLPRIHEVREIPRQRDDPGVRRSRVVLPQRVSAVLADPAAQIVPADDLGADDRSPMRGAQPRRPGSIGRGVPSGRARRGRLDLQQRGFGQRDGGRCAEERDLKHGAPLCSRRAGPAALGSPRFFPLPARLAPVQIERDTNVVRPFHSTREPMELEQVVTDRPLFAIFRRRRRGALFASGRPWHTGIAVRLRQARVGSLLAFARDGALVASGLLRRFWRTSVVERTLWLRTLELAWHASGAAAQLADAALAGETIAQLATRIANIARELSNAEAVAVFGRSPKGPVALGSAGGVPAGDLAARTLLSGGPERRSEGAGRAMSLPLRIRGNVVGALVLRFGPDRAVALKPLEPLLVRAGAGLAAAEREARKDRFLSLAAHELKTPLTSIKGFAYSLSRRLEEGEPADPKAVEILERQAERLHGLLEEMLEVSRFETQRFVLHQEPCEMAELVESALRSVRRLGAQEEIRVEQCVPLPLSADPERIERAIGALVLRAHAFGAPLTVQTTRDGLRARLRVTWAGARLTTHERGQAFEPRWEEPQSARQGLGMSLFVARNAVALHGGE